MVKANIADEIAVAESDSVNFYIPPERLGDPHAYVEASAQIVNARGAQKIKATDAQHDLALLREACERNTGIQLSDIAREALDPIERFAGLMESSEKELLAVLDAIEKVDKWSDEQKKKWAELIRKTIALQEECRNNPVKYWIYVGRDQETGGVMNMQPFHLQFFSIWNNSNKEKRNSLIMAPPGHGKSTNLRGFATWRAGGHPERRALLLYDMDDKPGKEIGVIKQIMRSPRYRAIFPDVRILERKDGSEDSRRRFTVSRPNWQSREPTFEGASIRGAINGSGYNDIYCDDICPPQVRFNTAIRREINERFTAVIETRLRTPKTAHIHMIATPWSEGDVHGVLARQVSEGRLKGWTCGIDEFAIRDDALGFAVPIWPEKFDSTFLEDRKTRDSCYALNYRLKAREDKQKTIRRICFYNSLPNEINSLPNDRALCEELSNPQSDRQLSIDPSGSAGKQSSDTGVIDGVITQAGYCFVQQVWFLHIGPTALQDWIVEQIERAITEGQPYGNVFMEAQGGMKYGVSLTTTRIPEILKERGCKHIPEFVTPNVRMGQGGNNPSKAVRLRDVAGYLEKGLVRFAGRRKLNHRTMAKYLDCIEGSAIERLRDHLLTFDGVNNTDGVDALTQYIIKNRERIRNPNIEAKPDMSAETATANVNPLNKAFAQYLARTFKTKGESEYDKERKFLTRSVA